MQLTQHADVTLYGVYTMKAGGDYIEFHRWKHDPHVVAWFERHLGTELQPKLAYELTASDIRAFERDVKSGRIIIPSKAAFKHHVAFIKQARRLFDATYHIYLQIKRNQHHDHAQETTPYSEEVGAA